MPTAIDAGRFSAVIVLVDPYDSDRVPGLRRPDVVAGWPFFDRFALLAVPILGGSLDHFLRGEADGPLLAAGGRGSLNGSGIDGGSGLSRVGCGGAGC